MRPPLTGGMEAEGRTGVGGEEEEEESTMLRLLDSMDEYLTLFDSLSSTFRQGWMDLACARHSMGCSRISTVYFDLNERSAASVVHVHEPQSQEPRFTLGRWRSSQDWKLEDASQGLRHRPLPGAQESQDASKGSSPPSADDKVRKERSKALSVFGALVSPKLRSTQASFETVLETLVDIANARSTMLAACNRLQQMRQDSKR